MIERMHVGGGTSWNLSPRCEFAFFERTSIESAFEIYTTFSGARGLVKLGNQVPESNLSLELKSGSPETMST